MAEVLRQGALPAGKASVANPSDLLPITARERIVFAASLRKAAEMTHAAEAYDHGADVSMSCPSWSTAGPRRVEAVWRNWGPPRRARLPLLNRRGLHGTLPGQIGDWFRPTMEASRPFAFNDRRGKGREKGKGKKWPRASGFAVRGYPMLRELLSSGQPVDCTAATFFVIGRRRDSNIRFRVTNLIRLYFFGGLCIFAIFVWTVDTPVGSYRPSKGGQSKKEAWGTSAPHT